MVASSFPRLFDPLRLGRHLLRNRIVMGAMHTGLEDVSNGPQRMAAFYAERARGGVGLIVTGGVAPSGEGAVEAGKGLLVDEPTALAHHAITDEVHRAGASILLQVLHAGGYARHDRAVAPSALRTPLGTGVPQALDEAGIERVIEMYVRCARLARLAGYDGVEILGAGGYLLNAFFTPRTNRRRDRWGGTVQNRARLALEIVHRTRAALDRDFIISYRLSLLDLVEDGNNWDDTVWLARELEAAGVDLLGSTFGWHESRVPTIAGIVPTAAFAALTARLRAAVGVPVVASNRINTPEQAEALLADGTADLIALARPLLADPQFAAKAAVGRSEDINVCIACNQSCLDRTFSHRVVSCLVNPRACHETLWPIAASVQSLRVAVVGAGLAGLACAATAAAAGHAVTLYEATPDLGGQFRLSARVPGKEDYARTITYFARRADEAGVELKLAHTPCIDELRAFDHVVLATGVRPRLPPLDGVGHAKVVSYDDVLSGRRTVGERVVIVGAGGIAFDVAEFLTDDGPHDAASFMAAWGIDPAVRRGGGVGELVANRPPPRRVQMLQRRSGRPGRGLGRTTGWIKRAMLERRGVEFVAGATCEAIDDQGIHVYVDGCRQHLPADTIVLCTGQQANDELAKTLRAQGIASTSIGGAAGCDGIDAERAIEQGMRVALALRGPSKEG